MPTIFVGPAVWAALTKAIRKSKKPCLAAVAYFGSGAAKLAPLPKGSRLVVDASEHAVKSGQTSPSQISQLVSNHVRAYTAPNLHAKVFVVGKTAYIGSNNVSNNSANQLLEALIQTTDPEAVAAARHFVTDLCYDQLTPATLKKLKKIYNPPKLPPGKHTESAKGQPLPVVPKVKVAQLVEEEWTEAEQKLHDNGLPTAKKRRKHPKLYEMDEFIWNGQCTLHEEDKVVQVTKTSKGVTMVSPPGDIIYIRSQIKGNKNTSCVYLERPAYKRRQLAKVVARLGHGAKKKLENTATIRHTIFAHKLLTLWSDGGTG
jgi:phosphatidylserine/phosphatidylglycerophosphate/cardiolipin synthase-like enzyme